MYGKCKCRELSRHFYILTSIMINKISIFCLFFLCLSCCKPQQDRHELGNDAFKKALIRASDEQASSDVRLKNASQARKWAKGNENVLESERVLGTIYLQQNDLPAAKNHFRKVVCIAEQLSDKEDLAIALNNIGAVYYLSSDYDSALKYYNDANHFFRVTGNRKYLAQNLVNLGMLYKLQGNYQEAFKISLEEVKVLQQLNEKNGLGSAFTTAADILQQLNRPDDALHYHLLAFQARKEVNDSDGMGMSLNNIGNSYRYLKNYYAALSNYQQSLRIKEKIGLGKKTGNLLSNMGQCYFDVKDYAYAEIYLKRAVQLCKTSQEKGALITATVRLARLFYTIGKFREAEQYAFYTQHIFPSIGLQREKVENNYLLSEILAKLGKTKRALEYADSTIKLKDSLFNSDMAHSISEMQVKYKTEQKENELLLARQEAIINTQRNRARFQFWGIIALATFTMGGIFFYFNRKKEQYYFKQKILEIKQEALIAQLDTHFVSDIITSINDFVENNDRESASEYLLRFSGLIRTVLENSFRKTVTLRDELINLENYFSLARLRFPDNHILFQINVGDNIDPATTFIPPMVLQVLVENSMLHAFTLSKKGILTISINKIGSVIHCIVSDNGIGRTMAGAKSIEERESYGNKLAESLIKIWAEGEGKTSYEIKDLADENKNPIGTSAELSFPFISNK